MLHIWNFIFFLLIWFFIKDTLKFSSSSCRRPLYIIWSFGRNKSKTACRSIKNNWMTKKYILTALLPFNSWLLNVISHWSNLMLRGSLIIVKEKVIEIVDFDLWFLTLELFHFQLLSNLVLWLLILNGKSFLCKQILWEQRRSRSINWFSFCLPILGRLFRRSKRLNVDYFLVNSIVELNLLLDHLFLNFSLKSIQFNIGLIIIFSKIAFRDSCWWKITF